MKDVIKKINTPLYLGSILSAFFLGILTYPVIVEDYKKDKKSVSEVTEQLYKDYYDCAEILLDSISNQNEDWFHDVLMEQDVYYRYEVSRDKIEER